MKHIYSALLFSFFVFVLLPSCNWNQSSGSENQADGKASTENLDLNDLHQRTFNWFWELADLQSGLTPDRWPTKSFSSVAAMGFGFTVYIIGVENGYITRDEAAERVLKTLQFLRNLPQGAAEKGMAGFHGFFYHFLDMRTGERFKNVELSTIDTGLLMAGILSCFSYFDAENETERNIRLLADELYRSVEWDWFMNENGLLSMGWHPGKGFLKAEWRGYNEAMILNILALGSPTHPVPESLWENWCKTYNWEVYQGYEHVNFGPLFGHQYSHLYIDFRGIQDAYMRDKGIDYFENSRRATLANRAYCIENPNSFEGYNENVWGLTACDGPANVTLTVDGRRVQFFTYRARGAATDYLVDDGTITPTAAGGSIPFAPEECITALKTIYQRYGDQLYGKYGFLDAFNLTYHDDKFPDGWYDHDYIGIDQGPIVIMLENHQTGLIWELMKKNPYIIKGLQRAGFSGGWLDSEEEF